MAAALVQVPGVVAAVLGGSRARGENRPDSDWDLGLYYREPLDVPALRRLAREFTGTHVEVAAPGGWGPWVNGGAWLVRDGVHIDWILRDADRVSGVIDDVRRGRYEVGIQPGHPLGFWSPCYAGEVATCRVLADPGGELAALRERVAEYPEPLRKALVAATWESEFIVSNAAEAAVRSDVLYISLSISRAIGILVQGLHAHHRRWLLNEKNALPIAAAFPGTPADFAPAATALLAAPGRTPEELAATVEACLQLTRSVRTVLDA